MSKRRTRRWQQITTFRSTDRRRLARLRQLRERRQTKARHDLPAAGETRVFAPERFSLENEDHDRLTSFLSELRDAVSRGDKIVNIDFSRTRRMIAGATLLFFSELQRLLEIFPAAMLRCRPSRDDTVNQILQHLKIYDALGYMSSVVPTRSDVVRWRTASSSEIDGERVGTLIETYKSLDGDVAGQLFRGASEAMMNSVNHAYAADRGDGLPNPHSQKWWMFCRQDEGQLFVALCDLGIGIPKSLPLKYPIELIDQAMQILSAGHLQTDSRLIQAAMELARTRTERRGRGLGLHDLKRIVDDVPDGALYVFSNRGLVTYRHGGYRRHNFTGSIRGTVVVWIIPLDNSHD